MVRRTLFGIIAAASITSVFPDTMVQTCIVHLIRNSLAFVTWKDRKTIMPSIKAIYRAETEEMARARLDEFEALWGKRYPASCSPFGRTEVYGSRSTASQLPILAHT